MMETHRAKEYRMKQPDLEIGQSMEMGTIIHTGDLMGFFSLQKIKTEHSVIFINYSESISHVVRRCISVWLFQYYLYHLSLMHPFLQVDGNP